MKALKLFLAIAISVIAFVSQPAVAFACSCIVPDPPDIVFPKTDAVFAGEVTQINDAARFQPVITTSDPIQAVFQVSDSWKGVTTTTVVIETALASASCGYEFQVGNKYIVYAFDDNGTWTTNLCTRTTYLASATDDLNYLNTQPKLTLTAVPLSLPATISTPPVMNYIIIAAIAIAIAGGAIGVAVFLSRKAAENKV